MKLLTLGTLGIITAPILAVISCGDTPAKRRDEARAKEQAKTKSEKLNRLTKEIKELIIIIVNYKTANRSGHIPANSINRFITNSTLAGLKYLLEQKEREIYPLLVEKLKPLYQQKQKERAEELTQDIKAYKTLRDDPNRAYDKPRWVQKLERAQLELKAINKDISNNKKLREIIELERLKLDD